MRVAPWGGFEAYSLSRCTGQHMPDAVVQPAKTTAGHRHDSGTDQSCPQGSLSQGT